MHIDWTTLALQAFNALVLVWLLARFLFRPVAKIIADRQGAASALIAEAAAAKAAAENAQRRAADEQARVEAERAKLFASAAAEAHALKAALEQDAQADIGALRARAQADIDAARDAASRADAERASSFALDIAARLFERLDPAARISGFVESLARKIADLPEEAREQIGRSDTPIQLSVPRALSETEAGACRDALAKALRHEPRLEITVDSGLIAGLELRTAHVIVRDSLRGDLERLRAELIADDSNHG